MTRRFGPFLLHRLLGRGGMGEVYLATRKNDEAAEPVILKRMRPQVARDEEYQRRLVLEAQVAARLSHSNLVELREFGKVGECLYIVMQHVKGYSLRRLMQPALDGGKAPPTEVGLRIGVGLLEALSVMHAATDDEGVARPILHRDVTPANLIVTHEGRPVLIDFGIAKDIFGPQITRIGRVVGTARYMAPEHRLGDFTTAAADVFSASMILFELMTGRRPWPPLEPHKELLRVVFDPPEIEPELRARLPADVLPIVLKGLACEPQDRWPSATAMLEALRRTDLFRGSEDLEDPESTIRAWITETGLPPDEALDELVVDHPPSSGSDEDEALAWNSRGELKGSDDEVTVRSITSIPAMKISIPPLPPRRDANMQAVDLHAAATAGPVRILARLGLLALVGAAAVVGFLLSRGF